MQTTWTVLQKIKREEVIDRKTFNLKDYGVDLHAQNVVVDKVSESLIEIKDRPDLILPEIMKVVNVFILENLVNPS